MVNDLLHYHQIIKMSSGGYLPSLYISEMKLFSPLLEEELQAISQRRTLTAGTVMMPSNSYVRSIPIVLKGSMRVMREDNDGREVLLYYIKPGESCIMKRLS